MNIQIFGVKKCKETQKAQRFFKERRIKTQFIDLTVKGLSKGELKKVSASIGLENLINREGKQFEKRNFKYIVHDIEQVLLDDALLLMTPIVRNAGKSTVGYEPEIWKTWL